MLPTFLAYGLAALALVRATPSQREDTPVTAAAGIEAGNYYLLNFATDETLFSQGAGQPVYTERTLGTGKPLGQWKVAPGAKPDEYKFYNIGSNMSTAGNNGHVYLSYPNGPSLTHVVTPAKGIEDMFIITTPGYGTWANRWDSYYKKNQVFFTPNTGSFDQMWEFVRIN
ncbi:hypothetical protein MSAN_01321500 [Mycena sanguinolenta]|uniref:Uncharacterized protein n=1 Tax=Mycena sanguinolenta TaxID=230812 RepID=A0A8H6YCL9_9AGAR|nr:hypothetical protein MSAN_01321500 [Mycena sanguinolenta]